MDEDVPLEYGILSKSIEQAQEKVEGFNFDIRRHVVQYDDVINRQREVIYRQRRTILEKNDLRQNVMDLVAEEIEAIVEEHTQGDLPENWDLHGLLVKVRPIVPLPKDFDVTQWAKGTRDEIIEQLVAQAERATMQVWVNLPSSSRRRLPWPALRWNRCARGGTA